MQANRQSAFISIRLWPSGFLPLPLYIFFIDGKNSPLQQSSDGRKRKKPRKSGYFKSLSHKVRSLSNPFLNLHLIGAMPVIGNRMRALALPISNKFLPAIIPGVTLNDPGFGHAPLFSINSNASHSSRANMLRHSKFAKYFASVAAALLSLSTAARAAVDFPKDILPIFQTSCAACHLGDAAQGKLHLGSEAEVLQGGASGPAVVVGKSADSLLIKRVLGLTDAPRMPMGGTPLTAEQVTVLKRWIDEGNFSTSASVASSASVNDNGAEATHSVVFAEKVRPILAARCYSCHGPDVQQNGLRLDSLAGLLKGSESGKIVIPGKADSSRLVRRLIAQERPQMPYGGPALSSAEIAVIRQWIDAGAPGPDSNAPIAATKPIKHWAYVKPVRPPVPMVKDAAWCRNPIDNFVLAKLESEGLKPSAEAGKRTLIRRVYLDLIGLPPTPEEVNAFLADNSAALMSALWTVCRLHHVMVNGGLVHGSTWRAMRIVTATRKTVCGRRGNIAIG